MISISPTSLKSFNTFGIDVQAEQLLNITAVQQLQEAQQNGLLNSPNLLVLGGGSNWLFTKDVSGLVIRMANKGIVERKEEEQIIVTAQAGERWNDVVQYCVNKGYAGVENLSLIPGTIGAAPIQNIGAYGIELKDVFHSLQAIAIATGELRIFSKEECEFGYRESVFKGSLKGQYIITEVSLVLNTTAQLHTHYGAIEEELKKRNIEKPTIKDISEVVSHIRVSKLPDPSTIGNAGSFFKNPVVDAVIAQELKQRFPDIVSYPAGQGRDKLAAGWLIEQCGWKGKIVGNTGTWKNQALVLVNHGGATGKEVFELSTAIIDSVKERFGVSLEREVNLF